MPFADRPSLAWAAGFLDGEGSIYSRNVRNRYKNRRGEFYHSRALQVSASQHRPEPLQRLASLFGGKVSGPRVTILNGREHKPSWKWTLSSFEKCQAAIAATWPFLMVKKEQAIAALRQYHSDSPVRRTTCSRGHKLAGENLHVLKGYGWRRCRICERRRDQERRLRQRSSHAVR